jgi:hypothetical protein
MVSGKSLGLQTQEQGEIHMKRENAKIARELVKMAKELTAEEGEVSVRAAVKTAAKALRSEGINPRWVYEAFVTGDSGELVLFLNFDDKTGENAGAAYIPLTGNSISVEWE